MSKFQPAPLSTYTDWLLWHLGADTRPTHWYDYPYSRWDFLIAAADFTTGGECGANARSIIVPIGVRHLGGDIGHNGLYYFDKDAPLPTVIPIFSDPEFLVLPGVADFIEAERARARAFQAEQDERQRALKAAMRESDLGQHVLGQWSTR